MSEETKKDVLAAPAEEDGEKALDLSELNALKETEFTPDPWWRTAGIAVLRFLLKVALFIGGIVYDAVKYLLLVVKYVLGAVLMIIPGIYMLGRKAVQMFNDMDWAGKLSFLVMGASQLKRKQWLDGAVFLVVELAFLFYMFIPVDGDVGMGVGAMIQFINLGNEGQLNSRIDLIFGFYAWVIVVGFLVCYYLSIKGAYDSYMITVADKYKRARIEAIHVIGHPEAYHGTNKDGEAVDFSRMTSGGVNRVLRKEYAFDRLSARVASRVKWGRAADPRSLAIGEDGSSSIGNIFRSEGDFLSKTRAFFLLLWEKTAGFFRKIKESWYLTVYDPCRKYVLEHLFWLGALERYCYWYLQKPKDKYGRYVLLKEERLALIRFSHKYDKYNDYLATIRDEKALVAVFGAGESLFDSIFGRDILSEKNGEAALPDEAKLTVKKRVSAVIGTFEITFPLGRRITKAAIQVIDQKRKEGLRGEELRNACILRFKEISLHHQEYMDEFVERYHDAPIRSAERTVELARDPSVLEANLALGKENFLKAAEAQGVLPEDGLALYDLYQASDLASREGKDNRELLERFARRYERRLKSLRVMGFHGQPVTSLRRIKQFADEKFAVTVMSLPVLGCLVVTIIPLLCSLFVGFTNWNLQHLDVFQWEASAWEQLSDIFGATSSETTTMSYGYTFLRLLGWTIVWAICATFSCYILGIIVALLINRKGLKFPRVWRTILIITVAVPGFISLMVMNKMLQPADQGGLINSWLIKQDWFVGLSQSMGWGSMGGNGVWSTGGIPFVRGQGSGDNWAIIPKLTVILVNIWIGIPFTVLSTSGILMNIPSDLYESSQIDGAGPFRQLVSITLPYIFFVTGPSLITTFVGNINNFNVIFFLTNGEPKGTNPLLVTGAGETSLLITWLYTLATDSTQQNFALGSALGIIIFILCGFFSLVAYSRLGSVQNEEAFQ